MPDLNLEDLMAMRAPALKEVLRHGHPIDPAAIVERQYLGVDLSLPGWARKLLWHTFRKTFTRDASTGDVRGWNVRMQQLGIDAPQQPLRDKHGEPITFGHYRLRETAGVRFPGGWQGTHYLDYGSAGNTFADLARLGRTPLVAVNAGSQDLLLGWEVMKFGPWLAPLPFFWALRVDGPLDRIVEAPRPLR